MICLDHGASKHPMNPFWVWIHRFLRCTMIQTDRYWISDPVPDHPKKRSLNKENIPYHLAKSDGNIRILIATIAYEIRVYSQGVKVIIHYGPSKNIEAHHYKNGREGSNTPDLWVPVNCRFHVDVLF